MVVVVKSMVVVVKSMVLVFESMMTFLSMVAFHFSTSMYMDINVPDIKCQCWELMGEFIVINEDNEDHK